MREFEANLELENILLNKGFIETTSKINKQKGKKSFKLSKNAQKQIYFDYINILILPGGESRIKLTENELKYVLLYFDLKSTDFKSIISEGTFDFDKVKEGIDLLEKELELHRKFNHKKQRQEKIKRILNTYNNIKLKY